MRRLVFLILAIAMPAMAQAPKPPLAQGAPETVTSEAQRQKDGLLSRKFVLSLLRPSNNLEGQFSRWKKPVCPHVAGLVPGANLVVERRIRDIAQQVGAPLDRRDPCRANITVFVTPDPQATQDAIMAKDHLRMVSAASGREAMVRHPVQAWYAGYYRDDDGFLHLDATRFTAEAWKDDIPPIPPPNATYSPPLSADAKANLTRLFTGMAPEMGDATVIVDAGAIRGMTLGSLGDYIALMTLAQTPATGRCQPAPSIANLFLKDCGAQLRTDALSEVDMAMLTALYRTPDQPENLQMLRLIGNMQRNLEGGAQK